MREEWVSHETKRQEVKEDSILQVNEQGPKGWIGCLLQVDSVESWGVIAYLKIPSQYAAFIRLEWEEFELCGKAAIKPRYEP